ncbi:MAG: glycosyltransferase [Candidatus Zhuqueibacterota bacterium]
MIVSLGVMTLAFLYLIFSLFIRRGIKDYPQTERNDRSVTVIVSARNEAGTIQACLESLAELDYPRDLLQIIVVDDRSEDNTRALIAECIRGKSQFRCHAVAACNPELSGKANAVARAMKSSVGEIVLITDADCTVPPQWVRTMTSYFTRDVGMVAGFTLVNHSNRLFAKLQAFDWAYLLAIGAGAAGLGRPLSCIGNNFGFRRSVYEEVGGFEAIGFSVAEDFALLKTIADTTRWRIVFPVDRESLVTSKPIARPGDFFSQRKRWILGGKSVHWFGKILISLSVLAHWAIAGALLIGEPLTVLASAALALFAGDMLALQPVVSRLGLKDMLKLWPLYKLFFLAYSVGLSAIVLASRKVVWKGVAYTAQRVVLKNTIRGNR